MSKVLHEQQGLRIVENDKNGFAVVTLHYTADPRKRSAEWKASAQRGLKPSQFEQEFEIIYDAFMGQKVFPEIRDKRTEIVIPEGPYQFNEWPKTLPMWAGFDYGTNNPAAFIVFTVVDGITYAIWELYAPVKNFFDFISAMKACPYWDQIRYIAHDPDMDNLKQRDLQSGNMISVKNQFERLGITKWMRGQTDEQAWLVTMQKHWCGPEVSFKILDRCSNLIDEFETATYVSMTERQLETQNYREAMVDRHNHALDATKYLMNSNPRVIARPLKFRSLVETYGWTTPREKLPTGRERELGLA